MNNEDIVMKRNEQNTFIYKPEGKRNWMVHQRNGMEEKFMRGKEILAIVLKGIDKMKTRRESRRLEIVSDLKTKYKKIWNGTDRSN